MSKCLLLYHTHTSPSTSFCKGDTYLLNDFYDILFFLFKEEESTAVHYVSNRCLTYQNTMRKQGSSSRDIGSVTEVVFNHLPVYCWQPTDLSVSPRTRFSGIKNKKRFDHLPDFGMSNPTCKEDTQDKTYKWRRTTAKSLNVLFFGQKSLWKWCEKRYCGHSCVHM